MARIEATESIVECGALSIRVVDSDASSRRSPLVLLHGTSGSASSSFWALEPMLATRYRTVMFDFIDPPSTQEPDAAWYAAQARAVIAAVGPDGKADVLGYSFGAVIAAALAARHPDIVDRLVLLAGWARSDAHQLLRNDIWTALEKMDPDISAAFSLFTTFSHAYLSSRTPAEIAAEIRKLRAGPDRTVKMQFNRTVDLLVEFERISSDTLVMGCSQDQMTPRAHARLLFGAIPSARYAEIPAGHGVVHERPAEVFAITHSFLQDPESIPVGTQVAAAHA